MLRCYKTREHPAAFGSNVRNIVVAVVMLILVVLLVNPESGDPL